VGSVRADDAFLQYGTGTRLTHLRGDAVRDGMVVYVVLRDGQAPWQDIDLGPNAEWEVPERNCHVCGELLNYPGENPCSICRRPRCPNCGAACSCGKPVSDRTCTMCHMTWARSRFPHGGAICADCT
jgi:hypothetical protein